MRERIRIFLASFAVALLVLAQGPAQSAAETSSATRGGCEDLCEAEFAACLAGGLGTLNPLIFFQCDELRQGCLHGCEIA